jgi:coenzyme F420-reducing hydrogenase delta subunit/ferredoxin
MTFEPRIVAFLCTWCSYTGADTAGIARIKSPANIRAVRVPCSGRVSPELVLRAFDQGADGVLVLGCHIGECHYDTGNHRAAKRLPILRSLMEFAGLDPERLHLDWVSASEGERFSRIATEFTDRVRALGPAHWRVENTDRQALEARLALAHASAPLPEMDCAAKTDAIRAKARELLENGAVDLVIGYEVGPRGRTRPFFAYTPEETDHLVWNPDCSHNLSRYLPIKLRPVKGKENPKPVAVVVKPCDSKAINVMVAESQYRREQVHVIGVACEGIHDGKGGLQARCIACQDPSPVVCDTMIGTAAARTPVQPACCETTIKELENSTPAERMEFWLGQFDRCIRCYACRTACPMCNCPICLYDRDESTFVGLGIGMNEKRAFHLGRTFHLAGRCIGCNECERACPMNIPLSLLHRKMAAELEKSFGFHAGLEAVPSPIVTILSGEYKEN